MEIKAVASPEEDLDEATIEDIESQKSALLASGREQDLASSILLPLPLQKCIESMRNTCVCKTFVARNPKTKLNELHLAQPLLLLLLAAGLGVMPVTSVVLSNIHVPSAAEALGIAALCAVSSAGFAVVAFIARGVPSHADLNVQMDEQVEALGGRVDGVERSSDRADALEKKMRLSWVSARRNTRDATQALQAAYVEEVQHEAKVQFKVKLLEYLSSGETHRATRQQRKLEEEFETNYEQMAKLYTNPLAELKRKKSVFAPNGRLSRDELREVVKQVDQTESAADGAYQFLGNLIEAVLEQDFDSHVAEKSTKPSSATTARPEEVSYSELVQLLLNRADTPPFRERYKRAFCLDLTTGADSAGPASPPPSPPPMKAVAVGAFVWLETYKDVILRKVWVLGLACVATSAVLLTLSAVAPAPTGDAQQPKLIFAIGSFAQLVAALVGWWTCQNKKDDLNMMRSLAEMGRQVQRLEKAEGRLRGALDAMTVSGAEMDTLDAEIEASFATAQSQLAKIRVEQERRREGTKAHTLTNVLMKFVNMDDRPYWYDKQELKKLHNMICAMTGEPNSEQEQQLHDSLRRLLLADELVPGKEYLADAVPPIQHDQLPGNQVLDILQNHKVFEIIMNLSLDDNQVVEEGKR